VGRAAAQKEIPPPLEMECLNSLWRLGEGSVRKIQEDLTPRRKLAYTTVMTLLERLVKRGRVARRKQGRAFVYAPAASRNEMQRLAVRELVNLHFDGSAERLTAYLRDGDAVAPISPAVVESGLDTTLL